MLASFFWEKYYLLVTFNLRNCDYYYLLIIIVITIPINSTLILIHYLASHILENLMDCYLGQILHKHIYMFRNKCLLFNSFSQAS